MNDPLAQLYDIEGLDPISWWPLAPAWWAIVAATIIVLSALSFYIYRRLLYNRSWQKHTLVQLKVMEQNLTPGNSLSTARDLSKLVRRIAIERATRKSCAGLEGQQWLAWLKDNDPQHFDWQTQASWLADLIYAPDNAFVPQDQILKCIAAIKRWIK